MKKNSRIADDAKACDDFKKYRRLLLTCEDQFYRLSEYLAKHPKRTLAPKARDTALRLLRDTIDEGNSVRLEIATTNAGLSNELARRQADFSETAADFLADTKNHIARAVLLSVDATATITTLDSITELLNDGGKAEKRPRYPKEADALKVLREAAKRKARGKYAGATNYAIALSLLLQENTDDYWKIMLQPKKKGISAPRRDPTHNRNTSFVKAAAKNWGGYISAYLKDHKDA